MKSPNEDYEIRKGVASDPGTLEDLLIFLSFITLVIYHVLKDTRFSLETPRILKAYGIPTDFHWRPQDFH